MRPDSRLAAFSHYPPGVFYSACRLFWVQSAWNPLILTYLNYSVVDRDRSGLRIKRGTIN